MTSVIPQCSHCTHFHKDRIEGNFCNAFPDGDGIPAVIILNEFDHKNPWPEGDHGVRFEESRAF